MILLRKIFFFFKCANCIIAMPKFHELGYELLTHPLYSPYLASRNYFLLQNMTEWKERITWFWSWGYCWYKSLFRKVGEVIFFRVDAKNIKTLFLNLSNWKKIMFKQKVHFRHKNVCVFSVKARCLSYNPYKVYKTFW